MLQEYDVNQTLDIGIQADLPANSGLGSSSTFTVGSIRLIATLLDKQLTKLDLARQGIHVAREILKERVGMQDQLHAAFGGTNRFDLEGQRFRITPLHMTGACQKLLSDSLLLILTGLKRHVSTSLEEHLKATNEEKLDKDPQHLAALATQAVTRLEGNSPDPMLREFGAMIHEGWKIKKALSSNISNPYNDQHYEQALRGGALGGKLSGAGNGGFLLKIVPPHEHDRLREAVKPAPVIKIGLDVHGSTILYS